MLILHNHAVRGLHTPTAGCSHVRDDVISFQCFQDAGGEGFFPPRTPNFPHVFCQLTAVLSCNIA